MFGAGHPFAFDLEVAVYCGKSGGGERAGGEEEQGTDGFFSWGSGVLVWWDLVIS